MKRDQIPVIAFPSDEVIKEAFGVILLRNTQRQNEQRQTDLSSVVVRLGVKLSELFDKEDLDEVEIKLDEDFVNILVREVRIGDNPFSLTLEGRLYVSGTHYVNVLFRRAEGDESGRGVMLLRSDIKRA